MKTFTITAAMVDHGKYVGEQNLVGFKGHLEIAAELGTVFFQALQITGRIARETGTPVGL